LESAWWREVTLNSNTSRRRAPVFVHSSYLNQETIEDQGDMMRSVRQLHSLQSLAADGLQEIAAA
jgi:hypothetical protein